jgi:hypothetical protein
VLAVTADMLWNPAGTNHLSLQRHRLGACLAGGPQTDVPVQADSRQASSGYGSPVYDAAAAPLVQEAASEPVDCDLALPSWYLFLGQDPVLCSLAT